jgi:hypothetical protein
LAVERSVEVQAGKVAGLPRHHLFSLRSKIRFIYSVFLDFFIQNGFNAGEWKLGKEHYPEETTTSLWKHVR